MPPIPEVIAHYQRSIEKCGDDQERLLHCLNKLFHLHVSVLHLQTTGIGRTVNKLRKVSGAVGVQAKLVVNKWKAMVTADDTSGNSSMDDQDCIPHFDDMSAHNALEKHKPHRTPRTAEAHSQELDSGGGKDSMELQATASTSAIGHQRPSHTHSSVNGIGEKCAGTSSSSSLRLSNTNSSKSSNNRDKSSTGVRSSTSNDTRNNTSHQHKSSRSADPNSAIPVHKSTSSSGSRNHHQHQSHSDKPSTPSSASKRRAEGDVSSASKERKSHGAPIEKKLKTMPVEEIDSSMGTSFADALGMMAPNKKSSSSTVASASKASSSKLSASAATSATVRQAGTSVSPMPSTSRSITAPSVDRRSMQASAAVKPPAACKKPIEPPSLLSTAVKLAPLDPAIAVAISNDYRPMPLNPIIMDCVFKASPAPASSVPKAMTDAELGASMSSKNQRTKVYSGVKSGALLNVPTLHEMCIRVLQRNIDALEATGGVPFEILKPVLDRANPEQLFTLEDFNPYLIEDTGDMWKWHCSRKFRGQKPHELETWRDMFMRCREEQETRLNNVTEIIKRTQTVAVPVKQTKITFVDSAVKPPRDVLKKQARFGTERTTVCTPAARVASLNNTTSNIARPGDARLRVLAGTRDHAQVSARSPRKAPLMQKTLQHMKGLYKR